MDESSSKRRRVLLIDDDEKVLGAMLRVLGQDWDIVALTDARDAVRQLAGGDVFDAILCDVTMSGMSGIEFYRSTLATHPALASKIVFVTGGSDVAETFLATIANRVIAKPFTSYALRSIVSAMVHQSIKRG